MAIKSATLPNGRTVYSDVARPFFVRVNGSGRGYGSLTAARVAAPAGAVIFFDYSPGCGHFVERIGQ